VTAPARAIFIATYTSFSCYCYCYSYALDTVPATGAAHAISGAKATATSAVFVLMSVPTFAFYCLKLH